MNIINKFAHGFLIAFLVVVLVACSSGEKSVEAAELVTASGFVCPEPSPRMEFESDTINIFTWTEYIPADILDCFAMVYDVTVNVDYFSSNEELYSKIALGEGINPYDVIHPSDYMIDVMIREELLQKLDAEKIPNLKNLDVDLSTAYGSTVDYVVPYQMGTQGIIYNTETVATPPTSWEDMWSSEYEGRIVAVDDSRVIIGAALLTLGYGVNETSPDRLAEAKNKLLELMPNIRVFDSDSPKTVLISGDADLGIVWNGEAFLTVMEDPRFEYVFPEEGSIIFYDGFSIPTTAPHVDVAYAWFNYVLQGDTNWLALVDYPYTNPNRAALEYAEQHHPEVYEAYITSPITNTPADEFARGHGVFDLGEALLLYDRLWIEVKQ